MNKKIYISIFAFLFLVCMYTTSTCLEKNKDLKNNLNYCKDIYVNNINDDDIKIQVIDIDIRDEEIDIGEKYNASAIVSMKVENNGEYDVELSNIDIYPYQGDKPTKYFVSTSNEKILGFIGNLKRGESTEIKMGVTLHNTEEKMILEIINIDDSSNEKVKESIKIK